MEATPPYEIVAATGKSCLSLKNSFAFLVAKSAPLEDERSSRP